jgi:hypothetical protein
MGTLRAQIYEEFLRVSALSRRPASLQPKLDGSGSLTELMQFNWNFLHRKRAIAWFLPFCAQMANGGSINYAMLSYLSRVILLF